MANTFTQIYIQIVFAVENRTSLLKESWREELHKYITGIVQNNKHIVPNGTNYFWEDFFLETFRL